MQLTTVKPIRVALAVASCNLLAQGTAQNANAAEGDGWTVDMGTLFYSEVDRVNVLEPTLTATNNYATDEFVSFRVISDTMSGASPMGASVSASLQAIPVTASATSGGTTTGTTKTIPANTLPLNSFSDQRFSVGLDWQAAQSRTFRTVLGGNISQENDYSSTGVSLTGLKDTEDKLTTFTLGVSVSADSVMPVGGAPIAFSPVNAPKPGGEQEGENEGNDRSLASGVLATSADVSSESKLLTDAIIGVTQVVHRRVLTQLNYSLGKSSGYLTDPYKIISLVDGTTGDSTSWISEKRPDSRVRQSIFWKTVFHLPHDVVHFSYRYYWDDWSVRAHTADIKYHMVFGKHFFVEPQYRYYTQSAADFFVFNLINGQTTPDFASADLRLAAFESNTAGLKVGYNFARNAQISGRVAYMRQTGDGHPDSAVGSQKQVNLFPALEAMLYSAEISFVF